MRYALVTALLVAGLCVGCNKPAQPKTTEPKVAAKPTGPLKALEPPARQLPDDEESMEMAPPMPRPRPAPVAVSEPARATAPAPAPAPAAGGARFYTVEKGDTLWKIATKVYGSGQRYRDILAANPGLQPTKLAVGQKLVIPE